MGHRTVKGRQHHMVPLEKMVADELKDFSDGLKTSCEAMGYGGKEGY